MKRFEYELKRQRWATVDSALARLCKWVPICIICYFGYLSIAALAGKTTLTNLGLWLMADVKVNSVFSHLVTGLFGVGGIFYGARERKLKRKAIERLSPAQIEGEKRIDPNRSSSRLTTKGITRPEDTL